MSESQLSHDPKWHRAGNFTGLREALHSETPIDLALVGVPTWRTSLSATNAGMTPEAVREALRRYSTHAVVSSGDCAGEQIVLHEDLNIVDAGDLFEPDLEEASAAEQVKALAGLAKLVVAIGGDNALTVPVAHGALQNEQGSAGIITLDAHHDLRDGRSNGSPIRRLIEEHGYDPKRIVQVGIADFANAKPYRDLANKYGITVIHRDEFHTHSVDEIMAEALAVAGSAGGPIHVDLDVDVCDRSVAPGCPASIPGGLAAHELRRVARVVARHEQVKSIDIAEVDAGADTEDQRTVRLAALLVLEAAAGLAERG